MWVLQNEKTRSKSFLPCNKTITIGRKDADIVISGDSSVSRRHTTLVITVSTSDVSKLGASGKVVLTDVSKFGTYVERDKRNKKVEKCMQLRDGDLIEFGQQGSIFKLVRERFNVAVSMIDDSLKSEVVEALAAIGGNLINGWHPDVDYLVVKSIKLNLKVVKALVTPCHIVSCKFVFNIRDQVLTQFGQVLFEPDKYLPKFDEPSLSPENCNFHVDVRRKKIFSDILFVFLTKKQLEKMGSIVVAAGGEVKRLSDEATDDFDMKNTCFVSCDKSATQSHDLSHARLSEIQELLNTANKRMIEEYEIGLSVLYCDASVYCNPEFELNSQNTLTQQFQPQSSKLTQSLDKESCAENKPLGSFTGIASRHTKRPFAAESSSLIPSDEETETVKVSDKVARPIVGVDKPSYENENEETDSPMPSYETEDYGTLENATDFELSQPRASCVGRDENKEARVISCKVPTVATKMPVNDTTTTTSEKVRLCASNKRQSEQESLSAPINFKKFRKVWPTYMAKSTVLQNNIETCPLVPKVIGNSDFFVSSGYNDSMSQGEFSSQQQDSNPFRRD